MRRMLRSLLLMVIGTALVAWGAYTGSAMVSLLGAVVAAYGAAPFWPDFRDYGDTSWR